LLTSGSSLHRLFPNRAEDMEIILFFPGESSIHVKMRCNALSDSLDRPYPSHMLTYPTRIRLLLTIIRRESLISLKCRVSNKIFILYNLSHQRGLSINTNMRPRKRPLWEIGVCWNFVNSEKLHFVQKLVATNSAFISYSTCVSSVKISSCGFHIDLSCCEI